MPRENWYASQTADTAEVLAAGFKAFETLCKRLNAQTAWLVCDAKDTLRGLIREVIGDVAKALGQGEKVSLYQGCTLEFYTKKNLPPVARQNPILVCFPSKELLDRVDAVKGITALVVLPWLQEDIRPWLAAHGARDILNRLDAAPIPVSNPVVENALDDIYLSINVSTGVLNTSDKHMVIAAFRILRDGGETVDPSEVRSWFVKKGMEPVHANVIEEIASDPDKFRLPQGITRWSPDILDLWRSRKQ